MRWLVTESLIEDAFKQGVSIFHTDNLLDVSSGTYIFQKAMGYETVRLSFFKSYLCTLSIIESPAVIQISNEKKRVLGVVVGNEIDETSITGV